MANASRQQNRQARSFSSGAFTLIELLVVIAVIALLISLLLPALSKTRKSGWLVVSQSNIRQICVAAAAYQEVYKGYMPVVPLRNGRGQLPDSQENNLNAICSWNFGGKNANNYWVNGASAFGGWFDHEAIDRPLNRFLTDSGIPPEDATTTLPAGATERRTFQIVVFKDPSDKASFQQNWAQTQTLFPNWPQITSRDPLNGDLLSSYDDVGTSYHANLKWHEQLEGQGYSFQRAYYGGLRRLRFADAYTPSRFCWITDQYADIVVYNPNQNFQTRNGYGDFNKSIMGFMDGHAGYHGLIPGRQITSYRNDKYTFVFEDLPIPR